MGITETYDKIAASMPPSVGAYQGGHKGHHHYIDGGLVATVHDNTVRLSANGDVAVTFEQEEDAKS